MRHLTFLCYAHQDRVFRDKFLTHLAPFKRNAVIRQWSNKEIKPGKPWLSATWSSLLLGGIIAAQRTRFGDDGVVFRSRPLRRQTLVMSYPIRYRN